MRNRVFIGNLQTFSTVCTFQAAYLDLAFSVLLLKFMPMSWKTLKNYRPVKNHCSCQDREHLCFRLCIARLQMAVKCNPCLNQFHSMINNCHFNKSVVYLIVTEKKSNNKRCAVLFSCMVIGHCRNKTIGLPPYLDKTVLWFLK